MELLQYRDLTELIQPKTPPCISLYMPTHSTVPENRQDPIRLRNLLDQASEQLRSWRDGAFSASDAETLLELAYGLLDDSGFWRTQDRGLALYLNKETAMLFRLPVRLPETVWVNDHFHVKPVLPLFRRDGGYYVLVINLHRVRLLACNRYQCREVALKGVPTRIEEFLEVKEDEKSLQAHRPGSGPCSQQGAIVHGYGAGGDDKIQKREIDNFVAAIVEGVDKAIPGPEVALFLAGDEYACGVFREKTAHRAIREPLISGNYESAPPGELYEKTRDLATDSINAPFDKAKERYGSLSSRHRVSDQLASIVPDSYQGRVDTLFVASDRARYGHFDPLNSSVEIHGGHQDHDRDLLDLCAVYTLMNKGRVFAASQEELPDQAEVAAIYRY